MRTAAGLWVTLILLGVASTPATAQNFGTPPGEAYFQLAWEVAQRDGRPVVHGTVTNVGGFFARDVWLRVERLDESGRVIDWLSAPVLGPVPPGGDRPFRVALAAGSAGYRVWVEWFDPLESTAPLP